MGNQVSTTHPDGSTEGSGFDLEGRREWTQDQLGRRTYFQYDAVGRLRFTIHPDDTPGDTSDNPYTEDEPTGQPKHGEDQRAKA